MKGRAANGVSGVRRGCACESRGGNAAADYAEGRGLQFRICVHPRDPRLVLGLEVGCGSGVASLRSGLTWLAPHCVRGSSVALLVLASGCASVDPSGDQRRAEALVGSRVNVERAWSGVDANTIWDGRADLTADAAARLALAASPEIRASLERIAASRADLVQSGLLPNPVLNVSLGFPIAGSGGETSIGVSLVQQLAWLLTVKDRKAAAGADLDAEVLSASDHALRLAAEARTLHARIVSGQRIAAERTHAMDQVKRALDLARRTTAAGEGTALEVNRREIRVIEFEQEVARAESGVGVLKRQLLEKMGRATAPAEWSAGASDVEPGLPASVTEEKVIELAGSQRLDVAAKMAAAEAARSRAGLAKSEVWADLEAGAAYARDDAGRDELGPALTVPIPVFDTGAARSAKAAAAARGAAMEAAGARARAVMEARSAYVEAVAARGLIEGRASELVTIADRNLELSRRAFAAGTLELTGLLEAEEAAVRSRIKMLELKGAAAVSAIEVERAVGGRLD